MNNYSLKNICLGVGIGLVIASVVNINTGKHNLSLDELNRQAALQNKVLIDLNGTENVSNTPTPEMTVSPTPQVTQAVNAVINIEKGTPSDTVADLLLKNGLIKNKSDFLKRLGDLKKEDKLNYGKFTIPKAAAIDEIINIITVPSK